MKNILVAIARPENAVKLIDQAVKLAKLSNGKIWILHVTEADPDDFLAREAGPQHLFDKRAKDRKKESASIEQWTNEITNTHNIPAEGLVIEGPLVKTIKEKVEENKIDLVIAGHQKKNFLYEMFTKNKKRDLIDELRIPLLAVPVGF
ncbi:hypothetical protein BH23BAC2_BH23BAC2_14060 [soil metagenome]